MIKIAVNENVHIFNRDESGVYIHRASKDCPCDPVIEHFSEGEGYIFVHRSIDDLHPSNQDSLTV